MMVMTLVEAAIIASEPFSCNCAKYSEALKLYKDENNQLKTELKILQEKLEQVTKNVNKDLVFQVGEVWRDGLGDLWIIEEMVTKSITNTNGQFIAVRVMDLYKNLFLDGGKYHMTQPSDRDLVEKIYPK